MKKVLFVSLICLFWLNAGTIKAQKFSVQTNLLDWATLLTFNVEVGFSTSQHFSCHAGIRYNPWTFQKSDGRDLKFQQKTFYGSVLYWPWHVYSGFWMSLRAQLQSFNLDGFTIPGIIGDKGLQGTGGFGPGLSVGYAFMLNESVNLEIGAGGWIPYYRSLGLRFYPDFLSLSFVYVF